MGTMHNVVNLCGISDIWRWRNVRFRAVHNLPIVIRYEV